MIHEDRKTSGFAVPIIAILLAITGMVLMLISTLDTGTRREGRVFVQVAQSPDNSQNSGVRRLINTSSPRRWL